MSKHLAISLMCATFALVGGCHKGVPEGQVAAVVNGDEVTLQEVNTELQANPPRGSDKKVAQREALQHIVERKLLLGAAREKKIDKSPEFLSLKLRNDELLLAQTYAKQQLSAVPVPSGGDITKFMGEHPNAFEHREQIQLDQIRFPAPKDIKQLSVLQQDHNLNAVAAHLNSMGIKFDRVQAGLDSAQVPTDLIKAINGLPAGEPFVLPTNGLITVNVVTGRRAVPTDPAQSRQAAVGAWRQQKFSMLISDQLKVLRDGAKITYQNGFAPPENKPAAPGAPAAAAK